MNRKLSLVKRLHYGTNTRHKYQHIYLLCIIEGLHDAARNYARTIFKIAWFPFAQRSMEKNNKKR